MSLDYEWFPWVLLHGTAWKSTFWWWLSWNRLLVAIMSLGVPPALPGRKSMFDIYRNEN